MVKQICDRFPLFDCIFIVHLIKNMGQCVAVLKQIRKLSAIVRQNFMDSVWSPLNQVSQKL